jgi:outer membrane biosynthesis protein TonB
MLVFYGQDKGESKTQSSTVTILGNNDNAKTTAIQIDKAGEDGETKVELYGKMTAIQIDKAGEGGEMKVKVNGKDVPYETLKTIPSEEIGEMKIVKLDGVGTIYVTTKDELEAQTKEFAQKMKDFEKRIPEFEQQTKEFEQKKQEFEQAAKQFAKADKDFKQAEKQFAQAEKAFKQMEKDVQQQNPPYIKAEKMPKFRNGDLMLFQNWMQSNVQYPAEAIEKGISGRVVFSFVVEADGSLSSYQLMASPDKILADEVERVFNSSPREWTAGEQDGKKVRVKYTVPVAFMVQGDSGASKDFASLYAAGMDYIAKGDKLEKEVGAKEYKNQSDYKADMNSVNNYYKSAMSALESAYALNPQHKPTVQSLYMIAFRLRDESGMMAKYEKYKSALQSL